ncbi:MAG: gluconate 2-dehydrogenase subunit 3 family protein [Gemmatimonadaceae bacterium]
MHRRDLLRAFGAATALALLPHESHAAWTRVASGIRPADGLSAAHLALIGAIADTLLPRTDTPGAVDVGVPAFVDVIASENYSDADRAAFVAGLDALTQQLASAAGIPFGALTPEYRGMAIEAMERVSDRRTEPARTYWRLKGLIVHGYFTSERVQKDVLKVEIMPGAFNGSAPMPLRGGR